MIGVAILGSGAIARTHVDAYAAFAGRCRIRTLCDLFPEKAQALAREKGLADAAVPADFQQAMDRADVDLVSVCLPPSVHREAAVFALQAGKHVLVEKPMASSLGECDAMIVAAEGAGRTLSVVSQNRFRTTMMRVKRVLESGEAGRILHTAVNSLWWRGQCYYDLWWRGTWEKEGGGCTLNHAIHHADLLLWMLGRPQTVSAFFANLNHPNSETEDFSTAVLAYRDGSVAQLTASLVHHGEEQEMIFQGERARISIPWKVTASASMENGFPRPDPDMEETLRRLYESVPDRPHQGHAGQIEDVLNAVEGRTAPLIDGREGRGTVELITAVYKSAQGGRAVPLPIDRDDLFYRQETMLPLMPRFHEKRKSTDSFGAASITLGREV